MASEVEFQDKEVREFLLSLKKKYQYFEKNDKEIGALFSIPVFQDVMEHFEKERGPEGKWQDWSPFYTEYMNSIGRGGNKILQFTGRLRQNFKPQKFRSNTQGFLWYNDAKVKGSDFPYAFAHDEGGPKLPQRQFMWLSDKGVEKIAMIALNYMLEKKV